MNSGKKFILEIVQEYVKYGKERKSTKNIIGIHIRSGKNYRYTPDSPDIVKNKARRSFPSKI